MNQPWIAGRWRALRTSGAIVRQFAHKPHLRAVVAAAWLAMAASAQEPVYPPPVVSIGPEQPLFLFRTDPVGGDPAADATALVAHFNALPEALKPFSCLVIGGEGPAAASRLNELAIAIEEFQKSEVPIMIQAGGENPSYVLPLQGITGLFERYPVVRGIVSTGLRFDRYDTFSGDPAYATPPDVRWAMDAVETAAQFGRIAVIEFNGLNAARMMANDTARPLRDKIRAMPAYVVPVASLRDAHVIPQMMSLMGFWLEGAVDNWGVCATSDWYEAAPFIAPGVYGAASPQAGMPPNFYRAMLFDGVMTGASVFIIEPASALWSAESPAAWRDVIAPTLGDILRMGLIPRRDFVQNKAQVAFQLTRADSSPQFHLNLKDLDAVVDEGRLLSGAYGLELPGLVWELIPNSGRHYWVPVLSPEAPESVLTRFTEVTRPGSAVTADDWTAILDRAHQPDGAGSAFISRIGRGVYVMHTRENAYEQQPFRVTQLPTPVYGTRGARVEGGVQLAWPFREDDFAYRVYKRLDPALELELAAEVSAGRAWFDSDAPAGARLEYAVTAFTNEQSPMEGTVNYGDFLVFSTVESRVVEHIVLEPDSIEAAGLPVAPPPDPRPLAQSWWPDLETMPFEQAQTARALIGQIESWQRAFTAEDLDAVMGLYGTDYVDPQGWGYQYARRAFQWFFERYNLCRLHVQLRSWDFADVNEGQIDIRLFVQGSGVAITDNMGLFADRIASFPRTESGEIDLTLRNSDGAWKIVRSDPAFPNMKDVLSYSLGPYDAYGPGPDIFP